MITVAIPTLGRPDLALNALGQAVVQTSTTPFEVLVLDNGVDASLEHEVEAVARSTEVAVRYVPVPEIGLHSGRHAAVRHGRGDILAYLDDDAAPQPGWLAGLAEAFTDPDVHLAGGRCLPDYEVEPPDWLSEYWERTEDGVEWCGPLSVIDGGDTPRDIDPQFIFGANFAVRRETLVRLGGFHPDGVPWELRGFRGDGETAVARAASAQGLRAAYHPDATVLHLVSRGRLTQDYFERRAYMQGISDSFTAARAANGKVDAGRSGGRTPKTVAKAILRRVSANLGKKSSSFDRAVANAYRQGYAYHQEQVRSDRQVRDWVVRPDYWDAAIPGG